MHQKATILQYFEVLAHIIYSDSLSFGCMHMMSLLGFGRLGGGIIGCWLAASVSPTRRCSDGKAVSGSCQKNQGSHDCGFHGPQKSALEIVINNVRV